jgi:hypothetical protein
LLKWKLMLTTLPFVVAVTLLKVGLEFGLKYQGVVEFSDFGVVLTGAVFLTGFLLAGTMADYKESEKLPGEVATTLQTIEELLVLVAAQKPSFDGKALSKHVLTLTDAIRGWLVKKLTTDQVFAALTDFSNVLVDLEKGGGGSYVSRAASELATVRKHVGRIDVISRTGFLPPAYALLEVLLAMILGLMMVGKFKTPLAEFILVPFVSLVNIYMLRLIKDIDDPFDFAADGTKNGGAEVDLFPIDEYRTRLAARVS